MASPASLILVCIAFVSQQFLANGQRELGVYNVDKTKISCSGISSGASMAQQFHVAYSSIIMGVGSVAGSPYWCAKGSVMTALNACMTSPSRVVISELTYQTNRYASSGDVDPTSNMYNDKVFVFHGNRDTVVDKGMGPKVVEFYQAYVNPANIKTNFDMAADHHHPTVDYGSLCTVSNSPYLGKCNYDSSYEILNHIYGNLQKPTTSTPTNGDFYEYDQKEFFYISPPLISSMDTVGYVYVPTGCRAKAQPNPQPAKLADTCAVNPEDRIDCGFSGITQNECEARGCCYNTTITNAIWCFNQAGNSGTTTTSTTPPSSGGCKLHIAFHGCLQGRHKINDVYAKNAGYNQVAELNNIIILYPQATAYGSNPNGCWDWWGYTVNIYATKGGNQPLAVYRMIEKLASL